MPYGYDTSGFELPMFISLRDLDDVRPAVIVGEREKQYLVVPVSTKEDMHKKAHRVLRVLVWRRRSAHLARSQPR